jgi:Sec-independent protein secretion pathway component TatC
MADLESVNKHLEELRKRLLRIFLVIGAITMVLLTCHAVPLEISGITLYYPTLEPQNNIAAQITNHMKENLVPEGVQLIQTAPGQAFFAQMYVSALVGMVVGMPVIIRELVGFIKPALKENEINVSRNISLPALGLFIAGCVFSYNFVYFGIFVQVRRIRRTSYISKCNGVCNFCITIFIGIWIFISASSRNVCNINVRNGRQGFLEKKYQICNSDNNNFWRGYHSGRNRCDNDACGRSNDRIVRGRHIVH